MLCTDELDGGGEGEDRVVAHKRGLGRHLKRRHVATELISILKIDRSNLRYRDTHRERERGRENINTQKQTLRDNFKHEGENHS